MKTSVFLYECGQMSYMYVSENVIVTIHLIFCLMNPISHQLLRLKQVEPEVISSNKQTCITRIA